MKDEKPRIIYRYSVKFVCGKCEGKILSRGHYYTAINVHNPSRRTAKIRQKISTALPAETPGHVVGAGVVELRSDQSFEIDCPDIYRLARMGPGCLLKGFVVLESITPLEVVAVYTASGADKKVETIHTERVPAFEVEDKDEEEPKRPDLVPIPPFPAGPPNFPSFFCKSRRELAIIVRNQGEGPAPASKLRVEFVDCGKVVMNDVPALGPVEDSPIILVAIPDDCWKGEQVKFRITVNATMAFEETDSNNNSVQSSCTANL